MRSLENRETVERTLGGALEFDPNSIPTMGSNAHNIGEAWNALVGQTQKFSEQVIAATNNGGGTEKTAGTTTGKAKS